MAAYIEMILTPHLEILDPLPRRTIPEWFHSLPALAHAHGSSTTQ